MNPLRIFISSVQGEFAGERAALRDYIRTDTLFRRFFEVFLFEDVPASDQRPDHLYLDEVDRCDIYVGLFGFDYGSEDEEGISPTEREFDRATAVRAHRLIFVKGTDDARRPKMQALIRKAQAGLIRKRFNTIEELKPGLYAALVEYLEGKKLIRWGPFDAAPCAEATLDDLDVERMAQFIRTAHQARKFPLPEGTSPEQLLKHLELLKEGRLTNAAVLLFGRAPQRFLISSEVRCAHYHGTEVAKPIPSYQVYKGTAFDLVDQAVDFVLSKINRSIGTRAESARAPRTYEIPAEVVTEAIVNAVAHRDYTSNGSVQVMLFADRLEIRNPGRLVAPLTLEMLREAHNSVPGNPLLAESLYLTEYIERMGTGTLDMIRRCVEAGLPEPEFAVSDGFITTIGRAAISRRVSGQAMGLAAATTSRMPAAYGGHDRTGGRAGTQGGQARGHAEGQARGQEGQAALSAKELAMLQACLDGAVPAETLSAVLGHSSRTGHFRRCLKPLLVIGFLEMTIPDIPRHPEQTYRLTAKGRAAVALDGNRRAEGEGQVEGHAEGEEGQVGGQAVLSAKELAMLQVCLDGEVAAETLSAAIGDSSRTSYFGRWLNLLLARGLLETTIPDGRWNLEPQFRLTDKGRAAIAPDDKGQVGGEGEGQVEGHAGGEEGQAEGHAEGDAEGHEGHEGQDALTAKELSMLQACIDGAAAAEALMAAAGYSSRSGHFRRWLDRLLRNELLEMTVPGKPRSPMQKYRLTDKGWAILRRAAEGHEDEGV